MKNLKKMAAVLMCLAMLFSLAACVKKVVDYDAPPKSAEELAELIGKIYEKTTLVDGDGKETMPLEPSDELFAWMTGYNGDGVHAAAASLPFINVNPYKLVLFSVEEGKDIPKVMENILSEMNLREWVCVAADKGIVVNSGSTILMIMADADTAEDVYNAFSTVMGGKLGEKLEK